MKSDVIQKVMEDAVYGKGSRIYTVCGELRGGQAG